MIHHLRESHYILMSYFKNNLETPLNSTMKENKTRKYTFVKCNSRLKSSPTTTRHPILENKRINFWGVVQDVHPGYERMERT